MEGNSVFVSLPRGSGIMFDLVTWFNIVNKVLDLSVDDLSQFCKLYPYKYVHCN